MAREKADQYYQELIIQLNHQGLQLLPICNAGFPVQVNGMHLHKTIPTGKTERDLAMMPQAEKDAIVKKAADIVQAVKEYMTLLETAPQIKASSLDGDYRALAECNGVVLAGHPTKFGVQFVTWEWIQDHTALWQGHYTDSYTAAKADFATRSGLISKDRLFSDQQLAEVYRCIHETLDNEYPLTEERRKLLTQTAEQIQWAVPSMDGLVQKSNEKELTQGQMYDPSMTQQI